ncbi:MAG TPA: T9SS type A sorting domain-containing protein [Flavobacterium sp.]
MKKILLSILILAFQFSQSQCPPGDVVITSQGMAAFFLSQYPNCTELPGSLTIDYSTSGTNVTDLSPLSNITSIAGDLIVGDNFALLNFAGMENLTFIGGDLTLFQTQINSIDALSNLTHIGGTLTIFHCWIGSILPLNNLTTLGGLTYDQSTSLENTFQLDCAVTTIPGDVSISVDGGHISGLNSVVSIGGKLDVNGMNAGQFDGFQNVTSIGGDLQLQSESFDFINLSGLTTVGGSLVLEYLPVADLNAFTDLVSIGGQLSLSQMTNLTDISALSNITSLNGGIYISSTQLATLNGLQNINNINGGLYLTENPQLVDIYQLEHINPSYVTNLTLYSNPLLAVCELPNICYYLSHNGVVGNLNYNAPSCISEDAITFACNTAYQNTINGQARISFSANCTGSTGVPEKKIVAVDDSLQHVYSAFTNQSGNYSMFVPQGTYNISIANDVPLFSATPSLVNHTFPDVGAQTYATFCLVPTATIDDMEITAFPMSEARPGFQCMYKLVYKNIGTTIRSGTVTFQYDASKFTLVTSNPVGTYTPGEVTFTYSNLNPFSLRWATITLLAQEPPVNNLMDVVSFTASVLPLSESNPGNNVYQLDQVLIGSYDPNDKTCLQGSQVLIEDADEYLSYRVRFQNTGTASAINVRVEDELDEKLDWDSVQLLGSSFAPYTVSMVDNKIIAYFNNINLPSKEQNELLSNGFFAYKVKPKPNVVLGDIISNTAAIYFDFNTPVITNTVTTEFVQELAVSDTVFHNGLKVFPNPVSGVLHFEAASVNIKSVLIYNTLGQLVSKKTGTQLSEVDLSSLNEGVYHCRFNDDGGNSVQRKVVVAD